MPPVACGASAAATAGHPHVDDHRERRCRGAHRAGVRAGPRHGAAPVPDLDGRPRRVDASSGRVDHRVGQLVQQFDLARRRCRPCDAVSAYRIGRMSLDEGRARRRRHSGAAAARLGRRRARLDVARRATRRARPACRAASAGAHLVGRLGDPVPVAARASRRRGPAANVGGAGVDPGDRVQAGTPGRSPRRSCRRRRAAPRTGRGARRRSRVTLPPSAVTTSARRTLSAAKPCRGPASRCRRRACSRSRRRSARSPTAGEPERRRRGQDLAPAGPGPTRATRAVGVDEDRAHRGGLQQQGAVGRDVGAVPGRLDGQRQVVLARRDDGGLDVRGPSVASTTIAGRGSIVCVQRAALRRRIRPRRAGAPRRRARAAGAVRPPRGSRRRSSSWRLPSRAGLMLIAAHGAQIVDEWIVVDGLGLAGDGGDDRSGHGGRPSTVQELIGARDVIQARWPSGSGAGRLDRADREVRAHVA